MQVLQEVVGIRLRYIRSVEIQRKEHYGSPYHDADINLLNHFLQSQISHLHSRVFPCYTYILFPPSPSCVGIEPMSILIFRRRAVYLQSRRVIKDGGLHCNAIRINTMSLKDTPEAARTLKVLARIAKRKGLLKSREGLGA